MKVFTIGYEGATAPAVLDALELNGVKTLIDVRLVPFSRKPGFSRGALVPLLAARGIAYRHVKALGCPSLIRDRYKKDGNWSTDTRDFMKYLDHREREIRELLPVVESTNCCLLCFERDSNFCHRTYVAQRLVDRSAGALTVVPLYAEASKPGKRSAVDLKTAPLWPELELS